MRTTPTVDTDWVTPPWLKGARGLYLLDPVISPRRRRGFALGSSLRLLAFGVASAMLCNASNAASIDPTTYYDDCSRSTDADLCLQVQRTFENDLANAYLGNFQAVRRVAHCLVDTCVGALKSNPIEACGWRVIAHRVAPTTDAGLLELEIFEANCASISEDQLRTTVESIARSMRAADR